MRFLFFAIFVAFLSTGSVARAELSRQDIEAITRDYILAHPEVLVESLQNHQRQADRKKQDAQKTTVKEHAQELFHDAASPSIGSAAAPVTLVEFFDYNCGACKMMYQSLKTYTDKHDDLRVVFKEYPIFGGASEYAAKAGQALHRITPEKYWDFHSRLMSYQGRVMNETVDATLKEVGADAAGVLRAAADERTTDELEKTRSLASALQATGTPLLIIGDEVIPHALEADALADYVAKEKKEKK